LLRQLLKDWIDDLSFICSFHDKQGTNRAFIEKFDGDGQSTKGRIEMLAGISRCC
jgi:hypothetical protein